jgi:hypothetical protein
MDVFLQVMPLGRRCPQTRQIVFLRRGTHPTVGSGAGRRVTVQRGLGPVGPSRDSVGVLSLLGPGLRRCSKSSAVRVGSVAPISVGFKAAVKLGRHVASSGAVSISFDLGRDAICPRLGVRLWFGVGEGGMSEAPARRRASGALSGPGGPRQVGSGGAVGKCGLTEAGQSPQRCPVERR